MKRILTALLLCMALLLCCSAAMAEEAPGNVVEVSNVDAFLAAIAPDTEIVLAPGEYNLTQAENFSRGGGTWYHWESVFDGWELVISNVSGLTIRSEDASATSIVTEPRYANVLRFRNCTDIRIEKLTIGHTKEQGSCAGGVLYFENSQNIEIQGSGLYGCGTLGVMLMNCQNFHMDASDIYECSEGCVAIEQSSNVLFENSKFYNCRLWDGVFRIYGSRDVAVINSEVFGNRGQEYAYEDTSCLVQSNCQGIYLGGLDVHDNGFAFLFDSGSYPVTLESSRFDVPAGQIGSTPLMADGTQMTVADFAAMTMGTVTWTAPEIPAAQVVEPSEDGKYHVTNVEEFLAAIGSDRTIFLEPGVYDLSTAANYGNLGGEAYRWERVFDGVELCISNVANLTIEGADAAQVTIAAIPRYANVLRFENTKGLTLRNVTAGHTQQPGECAGGVIRLDSTYNTTIEGCSLYGCGIIGVWATDCQLLDVLATEIYECSQGGARFYSCSGVNLNDCNLHDNGGIPVYWNGIGDVSVDGKPASNAY